MVIESYITSAFSKNNTGGNKAGIVIQNYNLNTIQKIAIANKLGLSETAFLSHSYHADYKIEYFTPIKEVPLCGHATIAAFVTLMHLNLLNRSVYTIETKAGILELTINADKIIFMQQNLPVFYEILNKSEVSSCFNTDIISSQLPVQIVSTGLKDIIIPINSKQSLFNAVPNFEYITTLCKNKNTIGIHAFSINKTNELTAICRNFAPLYGITEESATETSNAALACYLYNYGIKSQQYIFEQGHNLNNTSQIIVNLSTKDNTIKKVLVGGYEYVIKKELITIN